MKTFYNIEQEEHVEAFRSDSSESEKFVNC